MGVNVVGRLTKESSASTTTRQRVAANNQDTKCSADLNTMTINANFGRFVRSTETTRALHGSIDLVTGNRNIKLFSYRAMTVNDHDSWSAELYDMVEPGKSMIVFSSENKTLSFNAAIDLVLAALKVNDCLNGSK